MANWTETTANIAGTTLTIVRGGSGKPLLMLHDELGFPGWVKWNDELAKDHELIIPLQPGYGKTPRADWIRSYRDLGGFYAIMLREMNLDPIDVVAFSAGGYAAAEMAASDPKIFRHLALVAPMGLKPTEGEILDIFPLTIRTCLRRTVADPATPEFGTIYGGEMTPDQFEAFEDARAEAARLGWEPYMHNPSLGYLLAGVKNLPTLLVWGDKDAVVPKGCIDAYKKAIPSAKTAVIANVGHRPEIENSAEFLRAMKEFLAS
ncbi:MAG: alpha/beta fold hydrolase [Deltaproteobacteria bacterium]|nr:alpha/beta fold hydrolase [Deltaproteobacteria bacterium]